MGSEATFRYLARSWGVWCCIRAHSGSGPEGLAVAREGNVHLHLAPGTAERITDEELPHIRRVLRAVASRRAGGGEVWLVLESIRRVFTDYQPEVVACAIAEWVRNSLGLPLPEIGVCFDAASQRYIFDFRALES